MKVQAGTDTTVPVFKIYVKMMRCIMGRKDFKIPSKDGVHKLHVVLWEPEGEVKAVVQISHGMTEMIDRYDDFAKFLNKNGIAVVGNDHLGHGLTAGNDTDLGYFCPENMSATVVADLHRVTKCAKKGYPKAPYFLFGHSMGSFMARRYIMTYHDELSGAIICGTGAKSPLIIISGMIISGVSKFFFSDRFRSRLLKRASFNGYQKHIAFPRTSCDWLTRDSDVVDFYLSNKYCTFNFTVNGYRTIFEVLAYIQSRGNINKISKDLPIFFIAGDADPVGDYGKGVKKVYSSYKAAGIEDVSIKLYPDDRHEILNELDKKTVYEDVLDWISDHIKK